MSVKEFKVKLSDDHKFITDEMIEKWCNGTLRSYQFDYLKDILTGEYDLEKAREDVLSFKNNNNPDDYKVSDYKKLESAQEQDLFERISDCDHIDIEDYE